MMPLKNQEQRREIMVCGSIVDQDDISKKNESLPSLHRKMNGIHSVKTHFSYRYPSAVSKLVSPSFFTKNFSQAFCIVAVACSCLPLSAVSAEQNSAYPNSTNTLKTDTSYSSKPCTNCNKLDLETLANITLQQIKLQILHRLGFTHGAPNITNLPSEIPPVDDLLSKMPPSFDGRSFHHKSSHIRHESSHGPANMQNDEAHSYEESYDDMKTQMVIAKAKEGEFVNYGAGYPKRPLQFTFDPFSKVRVTSARLLLYQRPVLLKEQYVPRAYKLTVTKIPSKGPSNFLQHFEGTLEEKGGWVIFEFKPDATAKLFNPEDSDALSVSLVLHARFLMQNATGDVPLITDMRKCASEANCTKVPYLKLEIEEPKIRRNKRSAYPECYADNDDCCRYPLMVDFVEMKWDFIIAPKRYNAHYCAGECGFGTNQKHPHTHVTMMSQAASNPKFQPCCGPRSMSPIAMLYFNKNNNIVFGMLPGMIVDRCGCS